MRFAVFLSVLLEILHMLEYVVQSLVRIVDTISWFGFYCTNFLSQICY